MMNIPTFVENFSACGSFGEIRTAELPSHTYLFHADSILRHSQLESAPNLQEQ